MVEGAPAAGEAAFAQATQTAQECVVGAVVHVEDLVAGAFHRLPVAGQEAVIGRRRDNAEPLSGGGIDADVDLGAKTARGEYLIPADAHVRVAHPLTSGTGLMLRRSYSSPEVCCSIGAVGHVCVSSPLMAHHMMN